MWCIIFWWGKAVQGKSLHGWLNPARCGSKATALGAVSWCYTTVYLMLPSPPVTPTLAHAAFRGVEFSVVSGLVIRTNHVFRIRWCDLRVCLTGAAGACI